MLHNYVAISAKVTIHLTATLAIASLHSLLALAEAHCVSLKL